MVTRYWSANTLFRQLPINHNKDVQYSSCTYGNGATLLFFKGALSRYFELFWPHTTKLFNMRKPLLCSFKAFGI